MIAAGLLAFASCNKADSVKDPITVSSPTPKTQITKVTLTETQKGYAQAGNAMSFRLLRQLYDGSNLICSPLSLQYALAMTANGASGETLQEIIDFLGYGAEGIDALNAYCKTLLEQLPAVDLKVDLKVTDALLVNDKFPLLPSFQETVQSNYYAAVENMDFTNPSLIAARINDWAKRNTNGFIDKVMDPNEISALTVAFLMNALYFKGKWSGTEEYPMFDEKKSIDADFTKSDGSVRKVKMMRSTRYHRYSEMDGFRVLALPYAGEKFYMYILLPDENNLGGLLDQLQTISWADIENGLTTDAKVNVRLPKFDIENKFNLIEPLKELGIKRAFSRDAAELGCMFEPKEEAYQYWIGQVIQKARVTVAEWGVKAAAVTVVGVYGETAAKPEPIIKEVNFYADHPFAYFIAESTSGTILFEGVYTGK